MRASGAACAGADDKARVEAAMQAKMDSKAWHQSLSLEQTVTAYSTWPAMFGSGPAIGTDLITIKHWQNKAALLATHKDHRAVLIQPNRRK